MIDLSQLNKSVSYVGYEVGTSKVARKIQGFSRRYTERIFGENKPPESELATHVFAIIFNSKENNWMVYESHFLIDGVNKFTFDCWIQMQKKNSAKKYYVFPFELDLGTLNFYERYNMGYGAGSIENLTLAEINIKGGLKWADYPGLTCSEYIALCDADYKICNKYGEVPERIKPVHFQAYAYERYGKDHLIQGSN